MAKKQTKEIKPKPEGYIFGRPTSYKKEYAERLIEHMANGLSYLSFAGEIGVAEATLYVWEKENPDFLEAKTEGFSKNRVYWEKIARDQASGLNDGNASVLIFNLKNRFPKEWRDRQEIHSEVKQQIEVSTVDVSDRVKTIKGAE